ncbi:endonuclease VII domain-containing protein [Streptomyces decoyicus]|uniref:Endonuclease VII domain-containing protein n=1 Tax=Streptomyces decoyicus TaxID=249567 RepID=A0ABZ1FP55_9ACTN|nr:endonuclease VII domain-containing protein [Streptomyces decoyicus]
MAGSGGPKCCSRCKRALPTAAFSSNKSTRDGLQAYCRECSAEYCRQRQAATGQNGTGSHRKRHYGLSVAERDAMIKAQFGICPICFEPGPRHVDHDHDTGKVPGVPCFNCNSALGKLRDDPDAMRRAIAHLEGNVWKPILEAPGVYRLPS